MSYIGKTPTAVPLTSSDITNGIITTAKIADDAISAAKLAAGVGGKILQVVIAKETATRSTTSSSFADTVGLSVAITPASSSNKILWSFHCYGGNSNAYGKMKIVYGDGSELNTQAIGDARGNRIRDTIGGIYAGNDVGKHWSAQGLDSPNTSSAITYKLQWLTPNGALYLNRRNYDADDSTSDTGHSSLTLMEISA